MNVRTLDLSTADRTERAIRKLVDLLGPEAVSLDLDERRL